jgi:protoheme IX farnesyltransferase
MRPYLELTKPQRTLANVYTAVAGFLFATAWPLNWGLFAALVIGITLVIASACVANNYLDRELDKRMLRTQKRALPTHAVPAQAAIVLALVSGIIGFVILASKVNWLVVILGAVAYVDYVVAYGWTKRHSVWSTWIGTISGSLSLVAGYCAVTGRLDRVAVLLFTLMAFWQMAHFYAVGIYRLEDYRAANLPIWPVRYGLGGLRAQIISYIVLFALAAMALTLIGSTGLIYLIVTVVLSLGWLRVAVRPWRAKHEAKWAGAVFGYSLLVITVLPLALAAGPHLP